MLRLLFLAANCILLVDAKCYGRENKDGICARIKPDTFQIQGVQIVDPSTKVHEEIESGKYQPRSEIRRQAANYQDEPNYPQHAGGGGGGGGGQDDGESPGVGVVPQQAPSIPDYDQQQQPSEGESGGGGGEVTGEGGGDSGAGDQNEGGDGEDQPSGAQPPGPPKFGIHTPMSIGEASGGVVGSVSMVNIGDVGAAAEAAAAGGDGSGSQGASLGPGGGVGGGDAGGGGDLGQGGGDGPQYRTGPPGKKGRGKGKKGKRASNLQACLLPAQQVQAVLKLEKESQS